MILKAEHLIKKYKSRTVVKDVSVQVEQGEIVGLLGPNGAGKTTSFYMIVGLITPNGGRIFLDDQEITKEPVYKRAQLGVGYLAQEASVFRRLSVEDNIRAVLEMTKMTKEEQKELEEKEITAAAGGGAVEVTVSGKREITKVKLSEEVVDPDDIEMLEDLIMAATNEALRQLEEFSSDSMSKITGGMGGLGGLPF